MDTKPINNKAKIGILVGVVAVIIIVIIAAVMSSKTKNTPVTGTPAGNEPAGANAAEKPADEASSTPANTALKDATVVVPGANPITKDNIVVTTSGQATKNDVSASSGLAPQQTLNIPKEKLADSVIKLEISNATGFVPDTFTVSAGAPVTVSLTNKDAGNSRTLAFTDPAMMAVIIGTPPSETRAITFNAPTKPGTYAFIDGIPGHNGSGTMIVK